VINEVKGVNRKHESSGSSPVLWALSGWMDSSVDALLIQSFKGPPSGGAAAQAVQGRVRAPCSACRARGWAITTSRAVHLVEPIHKSISGIK
jgi:hypothetical protein